MIIIIEGIDKAGKSTLIESLKDKFPRAILVKNFTKPKDGSKEERDRICQHYDDMFLIMDANPELTFILDRWYLSEMVYSFKRGYEAMEDHFFQQLDADVAELGALLVLVEAEVSFIKDKFVQDGENYAKIDEVGKIMKRYRKAFDLSKLNKIVVEPTKDNDEAIRKILKEVK